MSKVKLVSGFICIWLLLPDMGSARGAKPLFKNYPPLLIKGEGDTGGEVEYSIIARATNVASQ
jgi:hypothetical protein